MFSTSVLPRLNAFNDNINAYLMTGAYNTLRFLTTSNISGITLEVLVFINLRHSSHQLCTVFTRIYCSPDRILLNEKPDVTLIG